MIYLSYLLAITHLSTIFIGIYIKQLVEQVLNLILFIEIGT